MRSPPRSRSPAKRASVPLRSAGRRLPLRGQLRRLAPSSFGAFCRLPPSARLKGLLGNAFLAGTIERMRVLNRHEAVSWRKRLGREGKRVVFTNGVFDILHPGHVRYLTQARAHGDALIVAVNSDRSVRAIKGPERPVHPEQERAEVITALGVVDAAVIFDEDTPHDIIAALQPDVLVKGADWAHDAIVGRDIVEARGGVVVRIPVEEGHSTTGLLTRGKNTVSRK